MPNIIVRPSRYLVTINSSKEIADELMSHNDDLKYEYQIKSEELYKEATNLFQESNSMLAVEKLQIASGYGHLGSQIWLSEIYLNGSLSVEKDHKKSFKELFKAATQNHLPSMTKLAHLFEMGIGTPVDHEMSFFWYRSAANLGDPEAKYNLGLKYDSGSGTDIDQDLSNYWIGSAAEDGHAEAGYLLGLDFAEKNNIENAITYFLLASQNGSLKASKKVWQYVEEGKYSPTNDHELKIVIEGGCAISNPVAQLIRGMEIIENLNCCFFYDLIINSRANIRDYKKELLIGLKTFSRAVESGVSDYFEGDKCWWKFNIDSAISVLERIEKKTLYSLHQEVFYETRLKYREIAEFFGCSFFKEKGTYLKVTPGEKPKKFPECFNGIFQDIEERLLNVFVKFCPNDYFFGAFSMLGQDGILEDKEHFGINIHKMINWEKKEHIIFAKIKSRNHWLLDIKDKEFESLWGVNSCSSTASWLEKIFDSADTYDYSRKDLLELCLIYYQLNPQNVPSSLNFEISALARDLKRFDVYKKHLEISLDMGYEFAHSELARAHINPIEPFEYSKEKYYYHLNEYMVYLRVSKKEEAPWVCYSIAHDLFHAKLPHIDLFRFNVPRLVKAFGEVIFQSDSIMLFEISSSGGQKSASNFLYKLYSDKNSKYFDSKKASKYRKILATTLKTKTIPQENLLIQHNEKEIDNTKNYLNNKAISERLLKLKYNKKNTIERLPIIK